MNWGPLIREIYGDIIGSVTSLNTHAYCKAKLPKICGGIIIQKRTMASFLHQSFSGRQTDFTT